MLKPIDEQYVFFPPMELKICKYACFLHLDILFSKMSMIDINLCETTTAQAVDAFFCCSAFVHAFSILYVKFHLFVYHIDIFTYYTSAHACIWCLSHLNTALLLTFELYSCFFFSIVQSLVMVSYTVRALWLQSVSALSEYQSYHIN